MGGLEGNKMSGSVGGLNDDYISGLGGSVGSDRGGFVLHEPVNAKEKSSWG